VAGNFAEPAACHEGATTRAALESIWFSDPEVAAYAHEAYGMPAHVAEFTAALTSTPAGARDWSWTWTPPGGAPSSVAIHDPPRVSTRPPRTRTASTAQRGGVSYLDFTETYDRSDVGYPPSTGTLAAR